MDGLLQEDLPLDTRPVVSLHGVDHLDRDSQCLTETLEGRKDLEYLKLEPNIQKKRR